MLTLSSQRPTWSDCIHERGEVHLGAPRVNAEPRLRSLTEYSHRAAWSDCTFERGELRLVLAANKDLARQTIPIRWIL